MGLIRACLPIARARRAGCVRLSNGRSISWISRSRASYWRCMECGTRWRSLWVLKFCVCRRAREACGAWRRAWRRNARRRGRRRLTQISELERRRRARVMPNATGDANRRHRRQIRRHQRRRRTMMLRVIRRQSTVPIPLDNASPKNARRANSRHRTPSVGGSTRVWAVHGAVVARRRLRFASRASMKTPRTRITSSSRA
mmetsp:Transcript_6750/g.22628  ORF Transcript_6750/g.22628 Transcript_6750/m.22628 type:complete len:200 (-) Transcript_6750:1184-1783(-)